MRGRFAAELLCLQASNSALQLATYCLRRHRHRSMRALFRLARRLHVGALYLRHGDLVLAYAREQVLIDQSWHAARMAVWRERGGIGPAHSEGQP
jgi:hypothetical protein